jgi:hypothetical protein
MPISDDWDLDYANTVLSHIDGVLSYDTGAGRQAAVGEYIYGATSGATAKVLSVTGNTASGTLTLTNVNGLFEDNELLEVLSEVGFENVTDAVPTGFAVGDVITDQTSGSMDVKVIEYNTGGLGTGIAYGISFASFADTEALDITGGQADVADADTVTANNNNDSALTTTLVAGTLAVPGTAQTNDSVIVHYDAGTVAIPEQAILLDATSTAQGLVEKVWGVTATGSIRVVDYNSTGGSWGDGNNLEVDQVIGYNNQVAGQVFTVGDVIVGATSGATGRVLADTGTQLILADESGTWTTTEDLEVGGTKIADANGTNDTLVCAVVNIPDGVRIEQKAKGVGGGAGQGGIYDAGDSLNIVRKFNSLYTFSQDTFDELDQMDDDEALDASVKGGAYSLVFGWSFSETTEVDSTRFLRQGGLADTSGANVWANPQTVGVLNKITDEAYFYSASQPYHMPQLYIEQDQNKIEPWWLEGHIDVLVKVRTRTNPSYIAPTTPGLGQLIPGGDPQVDGAYAVYAREYHVSTYDTTQFAAAAGGVNTVALGTADDTASDRNPNGTHTMDYTAGSGATLVVGEEFTTVAGGNDQKVGVVVSDDGGAGATGTLEYVLKSGTNFVNTDTCVAEVSGKTFTAPTPTTVVAGYVDDIAFPVVDIECDSTSSTIASGPFYPGEPVTQASTGATGRVVLANETTDILYLETTTGTFSGLNVITGDNSGATWTPTTTATYNTISAFNGDLNNGDGAVPFTGAVSGDLTGASPETVLNIYQYQKYLSRHEEETYTFNGPGTADLGTVGRFYRKLADAFAEIKPGSPVATFTGSLTLAQGWFLDSGYIDAGDIRSFSVIDNNGVSRTPPNLQALTVSGVANLWRVAVYRSTGAGLTTILRNEFDVLAPGSSRNQSADTIIRVGASTRTVSPLPADVPDSGVLRVLDPNGTGNYLRFPYSSVDRTLNDFTLASGTIGAVTGSQDLVENDNVHVCLIEETATGASVSNTIQYLADIPLVYKARLKGFKPFRSTSSFGSGGAAPGVVQTPDTIVDLP